ncbi:hypothetical protein [Rhizobium halophilum]|nr:hypothetical protein [Rhizobium halophilum]MCF6368712.1 hypothetical protein [Rhizobium halophilum]
MVLLLWFKKGRTGAHQPNEMNVMPMMTFVAIIWRRSFYGATLSHG